MKHPQSTNAPTAKVAVHHDLSIELHGENFSLIRKLTIDEALGLIGLLSFVVREQAYKASKTAGVVSQ